MTQIVPKGIECSACGARFEAYVVLSLFLSGNEQEDRHELAMIQNLTRNECPNCGRRATEEEVQEASEKPDLP